MLQALAQWITANDGPALHWWHGVLCGGLLVAGALWAFGLWLSRGPSRAYKRDIEAAKRRAEMARQVGA